MEKCGGRTGYEEDERVWFSVDTAEVTCGNGQTHTHVHPNTFFFRHTDRVQGQFSRASQ